MPQRRRRRFGRLHELLVGNGYKATDGDAGNYLKFLQGTNKIVVKRKPTGGYLKTFNVGVPPFNEELSTGSNVNTAVETSMSVQADLIRALFNTVAPDAAYGIERDLTKCIQDPAFYSAECVVSIVPTASLSQPKVPQTSGILQKTYKVYPGIRSGSIPYGRTTTVPAAETEGGAPVTTPVITQIAEEDVRKSLLNALAKGTVAGDYQIYSVHFVPEQFILGRSFGKKKSANAPNALPTG